MWSSLQKLSEVPVHWEDVRGFGLGLGLLLLSMRAAADPKPSVTGPTDGQPTREVVLAGPATVPLGVAISLDFEGACLNHEALVAGVERWLEVGRIHKRVTISVSGEERPELGARFWLLVDDQRVSLRRFEAFSGTCTELGASLSAAVALAIEAVDLADFPEPEPPPRPVLPAARLTARAELRTEPGPIDSPPPPPPRRRTGAFQSVAVGAQTVGAADIAPAPGVGAGLRSELGLPHGFAVRAGAHYLVFETLPVAEGSLAMRLSAGQAGVCWGRDKESYRAQGCLDVWAGALIGTPSHLERQSEQSLPWVALAPGVDVAFRLGKHWSVRLGTQLCFNLVRPRFEVLFDTRDETLDELTTPPLGAMLILGLDWNVL